MQARSSIRPERPEDRQAIYQVHQQAFGGDAEPQLVDALRASGDAAVSLVTDVDGAVVAHVLFSRLDAPMRALALAPVAVFPAHQGQGVGSALIRAGIRQAQLTGWEAVFVLGEPAYYRRFGFEAEAAKGFDCVYAGDHFMVLYLGPPRSTSGTLLYPAPFASLK